MFLVLFIQRNMESLHKNQLPLIVVLLIRVMKNITSNRGALFVGSFLFICHSGVFLTVIFTIGSFDQGMGSNRPAWAFISWYLNVFIFAFVFIIIVVSVLDLVLNLKNFFFHPIKFWISSDPFKFRLQQISFILFMIIEGPLSLFGIYNNARGNSSLSCLSQETNSLSIVLNTLRRATLIFYLSGFILFYTLIQKIYDFVMRCYGLWGIFTQCGGG